MEVEILSMKLVNPSSPTPQSRRSIPLSPWDQVAGSFYGGVLIYYLGDGPQRTVERKKKMEELLSQVLHLYYQHAGRFLPDSFLIDCNDAGVGLSEAKINCKLSRVLRGDVSSKDLARLVPQTFESPSSPLLLFQLNMFDCGGMAIGIRSSHRLTDAWTMYLFMNAWATACREGIGKVPPPTYEYDPEVLPPKDIIVPEVKSIPRIKDGLKVATEMLVFNKESIARLKAKASSVSSGGASSGARRLHGKQYFSRVEVVTALIWSALIRADQTRNGGKLRPSVLLNAVNLRGKTRFSIPENSCGNRFLIAIAKFHPVEGDVHVEYCELLRLVRNSITSTVTNCENARSGDELFQIVLENRKEVAEQYGKPGGYVFTSWNGLYSYKQDFGWGKPIWMSRFHIPAEAIGLMDAKDGRGIEVWLNLDEKTMWLAQQDPEVMAFTSSVAARL